MAVLTGLPCPASLARNKWLGMALGLPVLIFLIPHTEQMLSAESAESFRLLIRGGVCIAAFLLWRYGDYLFARALAAALIFLAWYGLQCGYAAGLPPVFPVLYLAIGCTGIVLGAKPYWLRDFLELAKERKALRLAVCGLWCAAALLALAGGFC